MMESNAARSPGQCQCLPFSNTTAPDFVLACAGRPAICFPFRDVTSQAHVSALAEQQIMRILATREAYHSLCALCAVPRRSTKETESDVL